MNKKFMFRMTNVLALLVAAVLYLLSVLLPETFGWFNLAYAVVVLSAVWGTSFLLTGIFEKNNGSIKKIRIMAGAGLYVITVVALVFAIALPKNLVLPIICVVLAFGLFAGVLFTGGLKWDQGDNQKVGYKNYYQRKADKEKKDVE